MSEIKLKKNLLLGVASAATQIEGGDENNSWFDWFLQGKIKDGSNPARANDHYRRWRDDFRLMRQMGIQVYRFGVEWSRIEPENGVFDQSVLNHYRDMCLELKKLDIKPLLTLHHFTNPLWFEKMGAFSSPDSVAIFLRFVEKVVIHLGDLVSEFITINEPNVYAVFGYLYGEWPPGQKSLSVTLNVMSNLASCHIKAYRLIHELREKAGFADSKVSFAHHMRVFAPAGPRNPWHRFWARMLSLSFQDWLAKACLTGVFPFPLRNSEKMPPGHYYDFLAINYYTRSTVRGPSDGVREGAPVNDLGWEIYPQGLIECAGQLAKTYQKPIYMTENGTCDHEDRFRSRYISEHLRAICQSDLPIERYYHWCFCDNFEWLEGESARFGLVHIDFETQERSIKRSGEFYSRVIREGGISDELADAYCRQEYQQNRREQ